MATFDELYEEAVETADDLAAMPADSFVREVFERLELGEPDGKVMFRVAEAMIDAVSPEIEAAIQEKLEAEL